MNQILVKRLDGKFEERLDDNWLAEYYEDPQSGLWKVEIYHHDVPEWMSQEHESLEEAQQAAHNFFDQI